MTDTLSQPATALIVGVGALRGLGAALGRRFGQGGFQVVLAGRSADKVHASVDALHGQGIAVHGVIGDATDAADVERFVDTAEKIAPLSVVVQNAGAGKSAPFLDVSQADFEDSWRGHALAGFLVAQAALRRFVPRGAGTLFFTGATASLRGRAGFAPFGVAKAGQRSLSQSLAREFGPKGIHVAHVIVDGGIAGDRLLSRIPDAGQARGPDGLLEPAAIAEAYWAIHVQHRSAWTQEIDLRPWSESF